MTVAEFIVIPILLETREVNQLQGSAHLWHSYDSCFFAHLTDVANPEISPELSFGALIW